MDLYFGSEGVVSVHVQPYSLSSLERLLNFNWLLIIYKQHQLHHTTACCQLRGHAALIT
uniref:Uncharacterized protein n=1 Tax=Arundo donax TaxID=35708 RepID=A0A0A9EQH0_ARUDO